jgi:hypothetical protein
MGNCKTCCGDPTVGDVAMGSSVSNLNSGRLMRLIS